MKLYLPCCPLFTASASLLLLLSSHPKVVQGEENEADLALNTDNVHWGYFSKNLEPVLTTASGSTLVVEMATHHACDDWDRMIKGDPGMEDIFTWTKDGAQEHFRGATGGGDGVHILTGPIYVEGAEPGDLLKVEVLDLKPRLNPNGRSYASNAAAWWGYQARVNTASGQAFTAGSFTNTPNSNDEVITIYEVLHEEGVAVPLYQFEWPNITDPHGTSRDYIQYPGTCVPHDSHAYTDPSSDVANHGWSKSEPIIYHDDVYRAQIPINYHVGCLGLAPDYDDPVDSIPPMPSGGNLDNRRIGIGTTMYYPVEVEGALLSMGDAHAAQGDSELDGTGIEVSLTGTFRVTVIKRADFTLGQMVVDFPLGETETDWIVHGFTVTDYLETFASNPSDIYSASSIDPAMRNAYLQSRKFILAQYFRGLFSEDDNVDMILGLAVDFGMTQLVDGNWGVHAVIPKSLFNELPANAVVTPPVVESAVEAAAETPDLPASLETVHFGYFFKDLQPTLTVVSGQEITVEMLTHFACNDWDHMIAGDAALETVFTNFWKDSSASALNVPSVPTAGGSGGGDGVHILTGPIAVDDAQPGDVIQVEILHLAPRVNPVTGRAFASSARTNFGFHNRAGNNDNSVDDADAEEVVTIFEIDNDGTAVPMYKFNWPAAVTDPAGTTRASSIVGPHFGTCIPHNASGVSNLPTFSSAVRDLGWTTAASIEYDDNVFKTKIPLQYHIGCMGLAPAVPRAVSSIPPMRSGGNVDNRRIAAGTTMYYPVQVAGGLLSMGDPHAAQGDSQLLGSAIETSLTGHFRITLHKQSDLPSTGMSVLDFPLGETDTEWIIHGFTETDYLETFPNNPEEIFAAHSEIKLDKAMQNCFQQTRKFLMAEYDLTEPEATTIITQGVDFGTTQLTNGNWGVHAIVPKSILVPRDDYVPEDLTKTSGCGESGPTAMWLMVTAVISILVTTMML